ncbi:MAG TPA: NIPSNAP family protein [Planctomycetota bacterium]|nr:NIPSNAP family protein [Planctomycetota bacterium]
MRFLFLLALIMITSTLLHAADAPKDARCFELRVYHAAEGKLDALNARFRDHTLKIFEKHGMTSIGYWMPLDNPDHLLYYILAFPNRDAATASWKAFRDDPDWKAAAAASEKDGKLVTKVDSTFLHCTDFSPEVKPVQEKEPRVFELRTYTCNSGKLPNLLARFRDYTVKLFEKHGMTNFAYWVIDSDSKMPNAGDTLFYMLAHKSKEAGEASFKAFRDDPDWIKAKADSEKDGSLTIKDGVKSVYMAPTDYSPTK